MSIAVSKETKKRLVQVKGKLEAKDGKQRSVEDVILELIACFGEVNK
jgi:hypothetical protein